MILQTHIDDCKIGKPSAHRYVYESTVALSYSICRRYIRDDAFHPDILQEAYAKVFTKLDTFDIDKGTFVGWLSQIVVNECLMHLRRNKKASAIVTLEEYHHDATEVIDINIEQLSRDDIDEILSTMPSGYRLVFILFVIDGYSHQEIAKQLDISEDTSRSQLSRARKWMQKHLVSHPIIKEYGQY